MLNNNKCQTFRITHINVPLNVSLTRHLPSKPGFRNQRSFQPFYLLSTYISPILLYLFCYKMRGLSLKMTQRCTKSVLVQKGFFFCKIIPRIRISLKGGIYIFGLLFGRKRLCLTNEEIRKHPQHCPYLSFKYTITPIFILIKNKTFTTGYKLDCKFLFSAETVYHT